MANSSSLLFFSLFCLFLSSLLISSSTSTAIGTNKMVEWLPRRSECRGTVAECAGEDEFAMGSEISRRQLQTTTTYISYGALQRNTVPCSRRGASYYNCQAGAQANPYSRGCSAIARCRS